MLKSKLHVTLSQASFKIENHFEELFPFVEIRQEKKKKDCNVATIEDEIFYASSISNWHNVSPFNHHKWYLP